MIAATLRPADLLALITDGFTEVFDARDCDSGWTAPSRCSHTTPASRFRRSRIRLVNAARASAIRDDHTLLLIRRT
jgi:hypothetical protein